MLHLKNILHIFKSGLAGVATLIALYACETDAINNEAGELPDAEVIDKTFGTLRSYGSVANHISIRLTQGDGTTNDVIFYSLSKPASQPYTLTVTADENLVDAYNQTYGTTFDMLPAANVAIADNGVLKIESGAAKSGSLKIQLKATGLTPGTYLCPMRIDEAGEEFAEKEKQQLFYLVSVRKLDLIENPLDTDNIHVMYLNTDDYQPLLADLYAIKKEDANTGELIWKRTIGNLINLRTVQLGYDTATGGVKLIINTNMRSVSEYADKYIRPLQDKGRKVCFCLEGSGSGKMFCNLTELEIMDAVAQVKTFIETYGYDGVNLWDRNSGYGKEGMPPMNSTSYPKFIKALREALGPDKLITVTDHMDPTEYFWDTEATGGIAVGEYIDYAWSGYMREDEDVQLIDPWLDPNEAMGMGIMLLERKPFAGLDPTRYGNFVIPWYPEDNPFTSDLTGIMNVMMWRMSGYRKSNIVVYADLITYLQNDYEESIGNTLTYIYSCIADDMLDLESGMMINNYSFDLTDSELARGWKYNYLTKDW